MYQNKTAESAERDPVQVFKAYEDKRPENMLKPDSCSFLLSNTVRFRITFCEINVYLHSAEVF